MICLNMQLLKMLERDGIIEIPIVSREVDPEDINAEVTRNIRSII